MMTLKELLEKIDIKLDKIDISGKRKMLIRCDYDTYIQTPERMPYLNNIVTRWYLDCFHGRTTLFVTVDRYKRG